MVAKKAPLPMDKHVGSRVRMRRFMLSMTQTELGDALGLTFQQVQKYEKGTNRIGASRLARIAEIMQVPVEFFFANGPVAVKGKSQAQVNDYSQEFLIAPGGLQLCKAYMGMDRTMRLKFVALAEQIAANA